MHGHINPLLEPARQLVKQGQCVLFVTYEQHRSAVEAAGIPFKSLGPDCIDRKQQSQMDPYATKKAKMLASAALFTGKRYPSSASKVFNWLQLCCVQQTHHHPACD
jgi:UDP:flavonoid glycosyltransferase YjiC (YdhE family)